MYTYAYKCSLFIWIILYHLPKKSLKWQGIPLEVNLWGNILGKMAKNRMKIAKSTFLGQNNGGHGGNKPIFWVGGGILLQSSPPQLRETHYGAPKPTSGYKLVIIMLIDMFDMQYWKCNNIYNTWKRKGKLLKI